MTTIPQPLDPTDDFTCVYDAWGRLVKVLDGETVVAEYRYDGLRRRIAKLVPSGENWDRTDYYYTTSWQTVEERFAAGVSSENKETPVTAVRYQYVWDVRYIDAPVCRDEDRSDGEGGAPDGDCEDPATGIQGTGDARARRPRLCATHKLRLWVPGHPPAHRTHKLRLWVAPARCRHALPCANRLSHQAPKLARLGPRKGAKRAQSERAECHAADCPVSTGPGAAGIARGPQKRTSTLL